MTTIIVACDQNNLIGNDDKLPWSFKEDMKFFKETTTDHVVIMGRMTWETIPKRPLKNRVNCIISRKITYDMTSLYNMDVEWFTNIEAATAQSSKHFPGKKLFIIGGEQIYKLALEKNLIDEVIMTRIKGSFTGNKFFPVLDSSWVEKETLKENDDFRIIKYTKAA